MRSQLLSLAILPLWLAAPALAAEPECRTFRDCVDRMQAANTAKDYAAAQRLAEAAYALTPDPNLLYNLGRFHRRQGHLEEAQDYYQRYLDSHADSLTPEVRAEVVGILAKLKAEQAPPTPVDQTPALRQPPATQPANLQPPAPAQPTRPALSWRFWTGVPVGAVGLGLLAFGAFALAANGQCTDAARPCDRVYDSLPQGLGTAIPGAVLLGVGVTLVAVDLRRRAHARTEPSRLALIFYPPAL